MLFIMHSCAPLLVFSPLINMLNQSCGNCALIKFMWKKSKQQDFKDRIGRTYLKTGKLAQCLENCSVDSLIFYFAHTVLIDRGGKSLLIQISHRAPSSHQGFMTCHISQSKVDSHVSESKLYKLYLTKYLQPVVVKYIPAMCSMRD